MIFDKFETTVWNAPTMMVLRTAVTTVFLLLLVATVPKPVSAQGVKPPDDSAADWMSNVSARLRTGTTYFDLPSDSRVGAAYGFDLSMPVVDRWGAYAGLSLNHFSGGSQVLGSVGAFRSPDVQGTSPLSRVSAMFVFDQFTDSRFGGMYVSQIRLSLGYALNQNNAAGLIYSEPITEDTIDSFVNPGFSAQVRSARSLSGFASTQIRSATVAGLAGIRDGGGGAGDSNSFIAGGRLRMAINQHVAAYSSAQYDSQGFWTASAGVEILFGRRPRPLGIASGNPEKRVIRAQSPGGLMTAPWVDPTLADALLGGNLMSPSSLIVTDDPMPELPQPADPVAFESPESPLPVPAELVAFPSTAEGSPTSPHPEPHQPAEPVAFPEQVGPADSGTGKSNVPPLSPQPTMPMPAEPVAFRPPVKDLAMSPQPEPPQPTEPVAFPDSDGPLVPGGATPEQPAPFPRLPVPADPAALGRDSSQ